MLVKDFLKHVDLDRNIIIFDLDKKPGTRKKEAKNLEMSIEYHYDYAALVEDFFITGDDVVIYARRKSIF